MDVMDAFSRGRCDVDVREWSVDCLFRVVGAAVHSIFTILRGVRDVLDHVVSALRRLCGVFEPIHTGGVHATHPCGALGILGTFGTGGKRGQGGRFTTPTHPTHEERGHRQGGSERGLLVRMHGLFSALRPLRSLRFRVFQ